MEEINSKIRAPKLEGYEGPFIGYYYKDYHPNYINKKFKSIEDLPRGAEYITVEKSGIITIRKEGELRKSFKKNDKKIEISYRYNNNNNNNNNNFLKNNLYEIIIYNKQPHYINFKLKLFFNLSLHPLPYPF